MQGTVRDSTLKSYIYTHITDNMQRFAADKIERGFDRNEGTLGGDGQTPDTREECEERLAEMIKQKNAEIAAEKERLKAGQTA